MAGGRSGRLSFLNQNKHQDWQGHRMEEKNTQNPFERWEQHPGPGGSPTPYAPQGQSPYAPKDQGINAPQGPTSYAPQGRAPYPPQQRSPYAPQGRPEYAPGEPSPFAPGQDQQIHAGPDMSEYASYQPQYYSQGQGSGAEQMDTPFGMASYAPQGNRTSSHASSGRVRDEAPRKRRIGPILGITGAVLVLAGFLTAWMLGWFHSRNGVYVWDDYAKADMTAKIEIDGDKAKITMVSKQDVRAVDCDVEFESDTVKFIYNGKVLVCDYDRKKGIITERDDQYTGVDIVFEKE